MVGALDEEDVDFPGEDVETRIGDQDLRVGDRLRVEIGEELLDENHNAGSSKRKKPGTPSTNASQMPVRAPTRMSSTGRLGAPLKSTRRRAVRDMGAASGPSPNLRSNISSNLMAVGGTGSSTTMLLNSVRSAAVSSNWLGGSCATAEVELTTVPESRTASGTKQRMHTPRRGCIISRMRVDPTGTASCRRSRCAPRPRCHGPNPPSRRREGECSRR